MKKNALLTEIRYELQLQTEVANKCEEEPLDFLELGCGSGQKCQVWASANAQSRRSLFTNHVTKTKNRNHSINIVKNLGYDR